MSENSDPQPSYEPSISFEDHTLPVGPLKPHADQGKQIIQILRLIFRVDVLTFIAYVATIIVMERQLNVYKQQLDEMRSSSEQTDKMIKSAQSTADSTKLISDNFSKRIEQIKIELEYTKLIAESAKDNAASAKTSAKAAEDNMVVNRARITTTSHLMPEHFDGRLDHHFTLSVTIKNVGLSPAYNVSVIRGSKLMSHEPGPDDKILDLDVSLINIQDLQNNTYNHDEFRETPLIISDKDMGPALHGIESKSRYYVYGYVIYTLAPDSSVRMYKRFCDGFYANKKVNSQGLSYNFEWVACRRYNDGN